MSASTSRWWTTGRPWTRRWTDPVVVALAAAHEHVVGPTAPCTAACPGATDGTILTRDAGLASVVYGPGRQVDRPPGRRVRRGGRDRRGAPGSTPRRPGASSRGTPHDATCGRDRRTPSSTSPACGSGTPPARGDGWLTGTTVVLRRPGGVVGGVDVRGGGPGTRETDLLDPRNAVERVHAVVLTGGSAFGLAAADGVMQGLAADGVGFPVGGPGEVVPIVPGRGRSSTSAVAATSPAGPTPPSASRRTVPPCRRPADRRCPRASSGPAPAPAPASSRAGSVLPARCWRTAPRWRRWSWSTRSGRRSTPTRASCMPPGSACDGEFPVLAAPPTRTCRLAAPRRAAAGPGRRVPAGAGHDDRRDRHRRHADQGAVRQGGRHRPRRHGPGDPPVHTMFDGDTLFAPGDRRAPGARAGRRCTRCSARPPTASRGAIGHAVLAAETVQTPVRQWRSYRDAFPSAFSAVPTVSDEGGPA